MMARASEWGESENAFVILPPPRMGGGDPLPLVLGRRRSVRHFSRRQLDVAEIGQLCWAAQGVTHSDGCGAAPSAGGLHPLQLYVVLPDGLYRYEPAPHRLARVSAGDLHAPLSAAALHQPCVALAPAVFVITATPAISRRKYGERAERYMDMEAGHVAQNLLLRAVTLGLGGVPVGAFDDDQVASVLGLRRAERPLYLIPVGTPNRSR